MTELSAERIAEDAKRVALLALQEDGPADVTTDVTVPAALASARIEFRSGGVVAGRVYADAVATACGLSIGWTAADGDRVEAGTVIGSITGALSIVLRVERPMLNLLQRACGIATATRAYVDRVAGTSCRILHTRKTAPGLRLLDASAVVAGGGQVHRLNLTDAVMVKDNHWRAVERAGKGLAAALEAARKRGVRGLYVEVENIEQLREACAARATRLLLDNQPPGVVRVWAEEARRLAPRIEIEATGGITLANVRDYAEAGADYVSVGALTHSVMAGDVAMEVKEISM